MKYPLPLGAVLVDALPFPLGAMSNQASLDRELTFCPVLKATGYYCLYLRVKDSHFLTVHPTVNTKNPTCAAPPLLTLARFYRSLWVFFVVTVSFESISAHRERQKSANRGLIKP